MAVKTRVALIMMAVVLCASAGASTTALDDTLVADEVGLYAYPPTLTRTGLDDTLAAHDEVAQYAATPAPSPTGLDDSLVTDEVAQYASAPAPSGGLEGTFLQADDAGLYAPAPAPISTGLDDTLLAVEAALDEVAADEVALSAAAASPSTGLEDTQPQQAEEVAPASPAAAPLPPSLLQADDSSNKDDNVAETKSIQKIIDTTEGCIYEIIAFANYNMGEEEKIGPACCKAVEDIVNSKKWPNIFPFNLAFPRKIKGYCTQYAGSPASAPTTSYAPALAPAEGPAYAPEQGDWMY